MATKQPSTLIEALNAFQQKYHAAGLDGKNPFFNSNYADLHTVIESSVPYLTKYGLSVIQGNEGRTQSGYLRSYLYEEEWRRASDALHVDVL